MTKIKTDDGKFTFIEGKNYEMSFDSSRTKFTWDEDFDGYRVDWIGRGKITQTGYINFDQIADTYTFIRNTSKKKVVKVVEFSTD